MISDFETRLADVLGARLPAPFAGRVRVAPAPAAAAQPTLVVGVVSAQPAGRELGGHQRLELLPGSPDLRRVLRLRFDVAVEVQPAVGANRSQILAALQAAAFALDTADLRDGSALRADGDQGFLVSQLALSELATPLTTLAVPAHALRLSGEGWFWPIGATGEAGIAIAEIRARSVSLPIAVTPARARLLAGGAPVAFTLTLSAQHPLRLGAGGVQPALPFGALALLLSGPGGRPGSGTLDGGAPGVGAVRLVTLVDNQVQFTYRPPAEPARDELLVALDDGNGSTGVPLATIPLPVVAG